MKIAAYLIGALLVLSGILYGAMELGVPQIWLVVIGLVGGGIVLTSIAGKVVKSEKTTVTDSGTVTDTETVVR